MEVCADTWCRRSLQVAAVSGGDRVPAGLPTVPYLMVQYSILTLVSFVPYRTGNVPFFCYKIY